MSALLALAMNVRAQGVESPPVTSFKPDSSMPSVKVPEFVITGKARIELPRADKPLVEIDSAYFQDKRLHGADVNVPVNISIGNQYDGNQGQTTGLYARASIGHYSTAEYLVSGAASVGGFGINGSVSGNYTSGFIPNTLRREFSIDGGISKDISVEGGIKSSNSMNIGYSRSGYSLYGSPDPALQRVTDETKFGMNSDMYLGELPLAFALSFDRFSLADDWDNTLSSLKLKATTQVQLSSGWLGFDAGILFGDHTLSATPSNPLLTQPGPVPSLNRSLYDISVGASYGNTLFLGSLTYSVGVVYFQYRDDSLSSAAKLYPDLRMNYRMNDVVSLFAAFNGAVREANLSGFLATDAFADGQLSVINSQDNADLTVGANLVLSDGLTLAPGFALQELKNYPVFLSDKALSSGYLNYLHYASKAEILSFAVAARYVVQDFSSTLSLDYRKGKVDSLSSIPNMPPFEADLSAAYKISPEFGASASVMFLSSRYADLALADKLDPVGLLNFRLSYDFSISKLPVELFLGGDNILDAKYFIWQGYQEFPLTLYIGVSSRIL
jgi:hypothetical protein